MRTVKIVDVIPNEFSDEFNDDINANISVNPNKPCEMVITTRLSFSSEGGDETAVYVSQDGGEHWSPQFDIPGGSTEKTVCFASASSTLYMATLRRDNMNLNVDRSADPSASNRFEVVETRSEADTPWVEAITDNGKDRIYVGYRNLVGGLGTTAAVDVCLDGLAVNPAFTKVPLESRPAVRDGTDVRPKVHRDGTVYAGYLSWTNQSDSEATMNVVLARDDKFGSNNFMNLRDPDDDKAGRIVAKGVVYKFARPSLGFGLRDENILDLAVDPNNSDIVYILWTENAEGKYALHVRRSLNRGVDWSGDLITVEGDAPLAAMVINSRGTVGLLYLQLIAPGRFEAHFRSTNDGTTWSDTLLARTDLPRGGPFSDYTRMVAVGPNFYGVFPAGNTPDPANFFPNGGGTFSFQRNTKGTTLVGRDGMTTPLPSLDPFFFKVEEALTGVVQGHVTDEDGNAIIDASVLVGSTQVPTDSQGFYTVAVDAGVYDVLAVQSGFVPRRASVTVCALATIPLDFKLPRTLRFTVEGAVTDTAPVPVPIPGATVRLTQDNLAGIWTTQTDGTGHYIFSNEDPGSFDGQYTEDASAAGFMSDSRSFTIANGATIPQDFHLKKQGILTGHVMDGGGAPLGGASVSVGSIQAPTDMTGLYRIMLDPGQYTATVTLTGFKTDIAPVTIPVGGTLVHDVRLTRVVLGSITGTVTDDTGAALGATVAIPGASTRTGVDGSFTLAKVQPGTYKATASAGPHFTTDTETVTVNEGQPTVVNFILTLKSPVF